MDRYVQSTRAILGKSKDGTVIGEGTLTETTDFVKRDTRPDEPIEITIHYEITGEEPHE